MVVVVVDGNNGSVRANVCVCFSESGSARECANFGQTDSSSSSGSSNCRAKRARDACRRRQRRYCADVDRDDTVVAFHTHIHTRTHIYDKIHYIIQSALFIIYALC